MLCLSQPLLNNFLKLLNRHATVRNSDNLFEILDRESQHRFAIMREDRFERLGLTPLRMLRRLRNNLVDGERKLRVIRLLNPEGAVIVEGRDALLRPNTVPRAFSCAS